MRRRNTKAALLVLTLALGAGVTAAGSSSRVGGRAVPLDTLYQGTLRVFVVEPTSRWADSYGTHFDNGFLAWALVADVVITNTEPWQQTVIWDGAAAGYGDITQNNVAAVAALYNAVGEMRDAYPPNGYYFWAYPVDAAAQAWVGLPGDSQSSDTCSHTTLVEAGLNTT
jgi:hypothetical protein